MLVLGLLAAASACKSWPSVDFELPFGHSGWVEMRDARVIEGTTPALAATAVSKKSKPLWVRLSIDEIDGRGDCENEFQLTPESQHAYFCPQMRVVAGARYRVEMVVFEDADNTEVAERVHRIITILRSDEGALELAGRPAD